MWLLSFIPSSLLSLFVNTLLLTGFITTFVGIRSSFPTLLPYKQLIQIVGILILVLGVYFKGCVDTEITWRAAADQIQGKIDIGAAQSAAVNSQIEAKTITKIQVVHDTKTITKQVIKEVEKIIDSECTVPPEAIEILNAAAQNKPAAINKELAQ